MHMALVLDSMQRLGMFSLLQLHIRTGYFSISGDCEGFTSSLIENTPVLPQRFLTVCILV